MFGWSGSYKLVCGLIKSQLIRKVHVRIRHVWQSGSDAGAGFEV
jgi:hypothetical protein